MKVKNRSLASISKWSLGRCRGKLKGYNKRIEEIRSTIKIADSLGYLTDDFFYDLVQVGIDLVRQKRKVEYRELEIMNPKGDWRKDDSYFENAQAYDMLLLRLGFDSTFNYYQRYRRIVNYRKRNEETEKYNSLNDFDKFKYNISPFIKMSNTELWLMFILHTLIVISPPLIILSFDPHFIFYSFIGLLAAVLIAHQDKIQLKVSNKIIRFILLNLRKPLQ